MRWFRYPFHSGLGRRFSELAKEEIRHSLGQRYKVRIERKPEKITARGGSILIVEDDPALRAALELFLRADGYHTAAAVDGHEAIDLVAGKDARPDIVVVDYHLPGGLTGLQVMAWLRDMLGHDVPALVLTGDISTQTLSEIARQGYSHRSKPIRAKDLTQLIQSLLPLRP